MSPKEMPRVPTMPVILHGLLFETECPMSMHLCLLGAYFRRQASF